jgi:hypothetical protein
MRHKFVHEFENDPPYADFEVGLDVPIGAKIQFDLDGGNIWVSANRAGWLHLARVCAEMALHTGFKPGYHFHRKRDWADSPAADHQEVSFELAAEEATT